MLQPAFGIGLPCFGLPLLPTGNYGLQTRVSSLKPGFGFEKLQPGLGV